MTVSKNQAGEQMVGYLEGEFETEDWEFEIADALKTFGVKYGEFAPVAAVGEGIDEALACAWHDYFVLGLKKLARDLPPNNIEDVRKAVEALEREDIEVKAKAYGGRVIFPLPKNGDGKRPADDQVDEQNLEAQKPLKKRTKTDDSTGFTFKTNGAYAVRISDSEDANSSKLNFSGHGPVTVTVYEKDTASASNSSRGDSDVKLEKSA